MPPLYLIHLWQGSIEKRSIHFSTCITPTAIKPCNQMVGTSRELTFLVFGFCCFESSLFPLSNCDVFFLHRITWIFSWAAGEELGRTLRNTVTVYYCAEKLRLRGGALKEERKKNERTTSKKLFSRPSAWQTPSPPTTVVIEKKKKRQLVFADTVARRVTAKSQWVSADSSSAAARLSVWSPWLRSIWQYADHVSGGLPEARGNAAPARVYWWGSPIPDGISAVPTHLVVSSFTLRSVSRRLEATFPRY